MAMLSTAAGPPRFTLNQVRGPARSAALITAVMYEAFLPAGGRALAVVVSMVAVSMPAVVMAAVGAVDLHARVSRVYRGFKNGEKYYASQLFNGCST
jgi:hypothetical protein